MEPVVQKTAAAPIERARILDILSNKDREITEKLKDLQTKTTAPTLEEIYAMSEEQVSAMRRAPEYQEMREAFIRRAIVQHLRGTTRRQGDYLEPGQHSQLLSLIDNAVSEAMKVDQPDLPLMAKEVSDFLDAATAF